MILWPTAESTAVLRVPSSTHSRHLVTSRRLRAQVSESRRTARAPPECPRVRCLSLCPARILAVPRVSSPGLLSLASSSDSRTGQLASPPSSFLSLKSASDSRTFRQAGGRRGGFQCDTLPWTLLASWLRYVVLGSRVHPHSLLELRNRLRSVVGREDMMAMAVVPCRLFSVLGNFLVWSQLVVQVCFNSIFTMVARPSFFLSGSACYCGAGLWFLRWWCSWTVSSSSSSVSRWYCRYVSPSARHAAFAGSLGFLQSGNCFTWPRSFRPTDVEVLLAARSVPSVLAPSLSFSSALVLPLPLFLARAAEFGLSFFLCLFYFLLSFLCSANAADFPVPRDWLDFRSSETPRQLDEP